jgi:site-specific recombinase XerD
MSNKFLTGYTPWNKDATTPTDIVRPEEVAKMLNVCSKTSGSGLRNRALVIVLWRGGLRIAEAMSLELHDVDMSNCTLHVRLGKGKKRRFVPIDEGACGVLQAWLAKRSRFPSMGMSPFVFCTRKGAKLSTNYGRGLIKRLATAAGIERRCHPHALRHSYAVELLNSAVPVNRIQHLLGHNSLQTTSIYLSHVTPLELLDVIRNRKMPDCVNRVLS